MKILGLIVLGLLIFYILNPIGLFIQIIRIVAKIGLAVTMLYVFIALTDF